VTAVLGPLLGPLAAALALAGGLRVETPTPDALCPDLESVRRAVRARVGRIEGAGEWRASYTTVHRPDVSGGGDVVRLELLDPAGKLRMHRDLPRSDESCLELAQAIALVLDLYFRQPAPAPLVATATKEAAIATPAPAPAAAPDAPAPANGDVAAAGRRVVPGLRVMGGFAGRPSSPALGLDLALTLTMRWTLGVQALWLTAEQERALSTVRMTFSSYTLRAYAVRRFPVGASVDLLAGPELLLALDRGLASDVEGGNVRRLRAAFGIGLQGGADLHLTRWISLSLVAGADLTPPAWAGAFVLDGHAGEVFEPALVRLLVAAGLSVVFSG
jgi:hypothetical protein